MKLDSPSNRQARVHRCSLSFQVSPAKKTGRSVTNKTNQSWWCVCTFVYTEYANVEVPTAGPALPGGPSGPSSPCTIDAFHHTLIYG